MDDPCREGAFRPKPPRPWFELPSWPLASRGLALLGVAASAGAAAFAGLRVFGWWFLPGLLLTGAVGLLAFWAALIHLTGGEEFDDHPFV